MSCPSDDDPEDERDEKAARANREHWAASLPSIPYIDDAEDRTNYLLNEHDRLTEANDAGWAIAKARLASIERLSQEIRIRDDGMAQAKEDVAVLRRELDEARALLRRFVAAFDAEVYEMDRGLIEEARKATDGNAGEAPQKSPAEHFATLAGVAFLTARQTADGGPEKEQRAAKRITDAWMAANEAVERGDYSAAIRALGKAAAAHVPVGWLAAQEKAAIEWCREQAQREAEEAKARA